MKVTSEMLKRADIFEFLRLDELEDIAAISKIEEFEQDDLIFKEGDWAEKIYVILEGRVSIETTIYPGKKLAVYTLTKRMFLGYPSLLRTRKFINNARCLDKVKVITISAEELEDKIFKKDCRRGFLIIKRVAELVAQKLAETRMQLLSLLQP